MVGAYKHLALAVLGIVTGIAYACIALLSQSLHIAGTGKHSLLLVLGLFGVAIASYWAAVALIQNAGGDRRVMRVVVAGTVVFRLMLLFSNPIEEIDLYRYLWDGEVTAHGVNPFRFSPRQVLEASRTVDIPEDLDRLVRLRDSSPVLAEVLRRIHFGQLPTVYPPVSQAVFALAALVTPESASMYWRMVLMKAWFVGFDLVTFWIVIKLLQLTGNPTSWSIAYGWCPLLIKEIANSGHLDSLAACLAALAAWCGVRAFYVTTARGDHSRMAVAVFVCLALATGAKLYPIVLVPLFLTTAIRRLGWTSAAMCAISYAVVTMALMCPMLPRDHLAKLPRSPEPYAYPETFDGSDLVPPPLDSTKPRDPSQGLRVFLSQWEMNDFFFLIVVENLRSTRDVPPSRLAWFSLVPNSWRESINAAALDCFELPEESIPFFITRAILSIAFLTMAAWWAWRSAGDANKWLRSAFLTQAWFWLLLPTCNPWYLTWCLPFLPFARHRAWIVLTGLVFLYYLRFWLSAHFPAPGVLGTRYSGSMFFDYIVTWIEFGPWLAWLMWSSCQAAQPKRCMPIKTVPSI